MLGLQQRMNGSLRRISVAERATPRMPVVVCSTGAGGFGKSTKKKVDTKELGKAGKSGRVDINQELGRESVAPKAAAPAIAPPNQPSAAAAALGVNLKKGWKDCGVLDELFAEKDLKVVELAAGKAIMLYRYKAKVYCTDAFSTAYQFPLVDAKVFDSTKTGQPAIEVPLDGTIYDLKTGKVELWCPKDGNPLRQVLGTLKKVADPIDLKTYRHVVSDGRVYVRVYEGEM